MKSLIVALAVLTGSVAAEAATRVIQFSGLNWLVKRSNGKVGPGPNYFSDSPNNVWVDAQGRLHLRITRQKGRWYCAEVISQPSFGHGTYRFYLDSPVDQLDPNIVLGLFTWNDQPDYSHREIDLEFARWGGRNNLNAQYVVQPYDVPGNIFRFDQPAGLAQSTHSFRWRPESILFQSVKGPNAQVLNPSDVIQTWNYAGANIPVPGGENARMNLWLFRGARPLNGSEAEVIVRRFEFLPEQ